LCKFSVLFFPTQQFDFRFNPEHFFVNGTEYEISVPSGIVCTTGQILRKPITLKVLIFFRIFFLH
jgi:hypothetical protein